MILRGARVRAQHARSLLHRRNDYAISAINQRLIRYFEVKYGYLCADYILRLLPILSLN